MMLYSFYLKQNFPMAMLNLTLKLKNDSLVLVNAVCQFDLLHTLSPAIIKNKHELKNWRDDRKGERKRAFLL